jgi:hypothetical protein
MTFMSGWRSVRAGSFQVSAKNSGAPSVAPLDFAANFATVF